MLAARRLGRSFRVDGDAFEEQTEPLVLEAGEAMEEEGEEDEGERRSIIPLLLTILDEGILMNVRLELVSQKACDGEYY